MSATTQKRPVVADTGSRKDNGNFKSFGCEVRKKGCASAMSISRSFCSSRRPVPSWSSLTEPDGSLSLLVLVHLATRLTSIRFPALKRARKLVRGTVNEKKLNLAAPFRRGPPWRDQDSLSRDRTLARVLHKGAAENGRRAAHMSSHPLPCSESFNKPDEVQRASLASRSSASGVDSRRSTTLARSAWTCIPPLSLFRVSS